MSDNDCVRGTAPCHAAVCASVLMRPPVPAISGRSQ